MNTRRALFAAALLAGSAATAAAQPQPPVAPYRPAFSPYLGLLYGGVGGGSPAFNYFAFVRPQMQAGQALNNLQQQIRTQNQELNQLGNQLGQVDQTVPLTGHGATFNNTLQYYSSNPVYRGGLQGGGGGLGGGGPIAPGAGIGGGGGFGGIGVGVGGGTGRNLNLNAAGGGMNRGGMTGGGMTGGGMNRGGGGMRR